MSNTPRPKYRIQSLERGLAVIRAFDADHRQLTLTEVARRAGVPKAAARRSVLTLQDLGYVRRDGRTFLLTPRVLDLGYVHLSGQTLADVAVPHLQLLAAKLHETSSLAILDGDEVIQIASVTYSRILKVETKVGTRFPAYATSMGRVLLAGLSSDDLTSYLTRVELRPLTPHTITTPEGLHAAVGRVRARGWEIATHELEEGLCAAAVPVHNRPGCIIAACNVVTHDRRNSVSEIRRRLLPCLRSAAQQIERDFVLTAAGAKRALFLSAAEP